jgi:glycosyltransferase involved in cell wall biosynthesis
MTAPADLPGQIAYLTGEYPRATDTFIQREVAALRALGLTVATCSIRRTDASHLVGPEQHSEAAQTFYVLKAASQPLRLISAHFAALTTSPRRYFNALALAVKTSAPGAKALLYQLIYFAEAAVLARFLKQQNVQHLHNHIATATCTVAMLTSEISGIPFSFTLHGPDIFFEPRRWRLDAKIRRASFVACISHFCRAQAMAFADPGDWDKLAIVHCGVDPSRYLPSQDRVARSTGHNLLFVGRLAAVKGLPVLFQALAGMVSDHPDLKLTLIGDGPDRVLLQGQVNQFGLQDHVAFSGYQSQDAVAKALLENDLLVLPSFAEGVPVVLMEAMAAGLPVLTTRIAGVPELVEDGISGILVPPGSVNALADGLRKLLADADLRHRMGQAGRQKVIAEFTASTEAARLATLFAGVANPAAPHPALRPDPLKPRAE